MSNSNNKSSYGHEASSLDSNFAKLRLNGEAIGLGNSEDLLLLLECPVCNELQVAPIYNCELGHSICSNCRQSIQLCPICAHPFTKSRNFLAESIAGTARIKCIYQDKGCDAVMMVSERGNHISTCVYRPVVCQLNRVVNCKGTQIEVPFYFTHLKTAHEIAGVQLEDFDTFCDKTERIAVLNEGAKWPPFYVVIQNKVFLKITIFLNGNLYWWLTLVSVFPEEAQDYQATIVVLMKHSDTLKFSYSIPVHHFRRLPQDIIENGECASLPFTSLATFCFGEDDRNVHYKYCWCMKFSVSKKQK